MLHYIKKRGEDYFNIIRNDKYIFASSVLSIRKFIEEAFKAKIPMAYNGEIYNDALSDTFYIKKIIEKASCKSKCVCTNKDFEKFSKNEWVNNNTDSKICFCIGNIVHEKILHDSEMAVMFIYMDNVYFFKDDIGRKSLGFTKNKNFTVSSVLFDFEINPRYIYKYNIKNNELSRQVKKHLSYLEPFVIDKNMLFLDAFVNKITHSIIRRMHNHPNVVLFSGGIDSLLIVAILSKTTNSIRPIYLINTQFGTEKNSFDRINGISAFLELQRIYPKQKFIFIKNDITKEKIDKHLKRVKNLINPKKTNMDQNIGLCLFFSAKKAKKFSKVIFVGSGADELFCGYKNHNVENDLRHRIDSDIQNIWERNLGRDDRVISDNGVEARFPYLDIDIIKFVRIIPPELNFTIDNGIMQNKSLIRNALKKLGFEQSYSHKKKAMQFGSGIFKINN